MSAGARGFVLALAVLQAVLLTSLAPHPRIAALALPVVTGEAPLDHAERVALAVLAADQAGDAHRAAPFYTSPWIRDSYAWGMIPDDAGTLATYAGSELRYWLARHRPSGGWVTFQYSGWYDETAILISAVLDAYRLSGDRGMVRRALPLLRRGWTWLFRNVDARHGSDCLLWTAVSSGGPWAADWVDQVARRGYTPQLEGLWYGATHAMAALEWLAGSKTAAARDNRLASCIARDVNHLLWTVHAPEHRYARSLAAFGHYRAWPRGPDYFEIDGNALLIAAGVAGRSRSAGVLATIAAHAGYLLGADGAGPARVLYGDYAPADYGPIHNWMGPGRYQNAYWPGVGGLLAVAAARDDSTTLAVTVLRGLARRASDAGSAFYEWYGDGGTAGGAALYGWGARMYILALYRAYLGVDDSSSMTAPADLVLRAAPGPARGAMVRLGLHITIITHGQGRFQYALLGRRLLRSPVVPARLLYDGAVLQVYRR